MTPKTIRVMQAALACICVQASPAHAIELNLCWTGANGYTMTGRMTLPDAAMAKAVVTKADVTRFKISDYHDGRLLGTWNMADAGPDTTWFLRFHPDTMLFPGGGMFATEESQGWNANGGVTDCGTPGFGFNMRRMSVSTASICKTAASHPIPRYLPRLIRSRRNAPSRHPLASPSVKTIDGESLCSIDSGPTG